MACSFRAGQQQSGYRTFNFLHVKWPRWLGGGLLGFDGHFILFPGGR